LSWEAIGVQRNERDEKAAARVPELARIERWNIFFACTIADLPVVKTAVVVGRKRFREGYSAALIRLVWVAIHRQLLFSRTQVSVNRPQWSKGLSR